MCVLSQFILYTNNIRVRKKRQTFDTHTHTHKHKLTRTPSAVRVLLCTYVFVVYWVRGKRIMCTHRVGKYATLFLCNLMVDDAATQWLQTQRIGTKIWLRHQFSNDAIKTWVVMYSPVGYGFVPHCEGLVFVIWLHVIIFLNAETPSSAVYTSVVYLCALVHSFVYDCLAWATILLVIRSAPLHSVECNEGEFFFFAKSYHQHLLYHTLCKNSI